MAGESVAASPLSRLMHTPNFNLSIVTVMGFSCTLDISWIKLHVANNLANHPRFSSILVFGNKKRYKMSWKETKVNVDEHVFKHDLDPELEPEHADAFLEEFTKTLAEKPFDLSKPLWEIHLLNMKTSSSNSSAVIKIHHSLGDGVSLISIVLACGRSISDPEALPVLPAASKRRVEESTNQGFFRTIFSLFWRMILIMYYTLIDSMELAATILFYKDSESVIRLKDDGKVSPKRYVRRILSMEDVRLIKNAMETTVNDVIFGVTEAALTRYLHRRYEKSQSIENGGQNSTNTNFLPNRLRIRGAIPFNMRPSASVQDAHEVMRNERKFNPKLWGNMVGFVLFPLRIHVEEDPLNYLRNAKALMNRKKLSYQSLIEYYFVNLLVYIFGTKLAMFVVSTFHRALTFEISSVMGPRDEISIFGYPVTYIAPTVAGVPMSMVIHFQSYADKLTVSLALDEKLFPDPQQLCEDFHSSLQLIKQAVIAKQTL